jgi:trehalose 6-phosphate synthase/phosphatase
VSVPSRGGIEEYRALRAEVETRVGRLNGKYATLRNSPIHFIFDSIPFTDLCALYAIADVAIVTPLIDGMNLVAKEFVLCQRENAGCLILSEFAGAAEELFNAFLVNPYDVRAVAETLSTALALSPEQKRALIDPMRERVIRYDARHWARSFIKDLGALVVRGPDLSGADLAQAYDRLAQTISAGKRVALFLDYDGTLREIEREPSLAKPTPALHDFLKRLTELMNVDTTIITGRSRDSIEAWLGDYPLRLVAEHGASRRQPGSQEWEQLDAAVNYAWKEELLNILRLYEEATPGSLVEEKRSSLVWHYRMADQEFGEWKARKLTRQLGALTANQPIQVHHGKKIVEVSAAQVNKGAAVARLLAEQHPYECVLCAGDDRTDEGMFALNTPGLLSVKVGDGPTQAAFRVADPAMLREFLVKALLRTV